MAEDYLTDDEQWEAAKRWLAQNGLWLLGGVVLAAALSFGWRFYEGHGNERALRAAGEFDTMTAALGAADPRGADAQILQLKISDLGAAAAPSDTKGQS